MPSPIIHTGLGFIIYRVIRDRFHGQYKLKNTGLPLVLVLAVGISLLPDIDVIPGILANDLGRYHNNISHSIIFGSMVALLLAVIVSRTLKSGIWIWLVIFTLGYSMHALLDFFTMGERGVMLFWPLTSERFSSPLKLFYGVRWSEGLFSQVHLHTLVNEIVFLALVGLVLLFIERKKLNAVKNNADRNPRINRRSGSCP